MPKKKHSGRGRKRCSDQERDLVTARERLERRIAGRGQAVGAGRRERREDGEADRAAHHERRVRDA